MEDNGLFIKSLFRKHAALNVLSLLTSTIGPIVCNILAGLWYGSEGLAIVAICAPLFFLAGFFGFAISGGASVLASKGIARDDTDEIHKIYSAAAAISVIVGGIVFGGLLMFHRVIVRILAGNTGMNIDTYYTCIVIYGFVTVFLFIPLNFSRVVGQNKIGVLLTSVMTIVTLVAVPVLKPFIGIASIALGQATGTAIATALGMFLLRKKVRLEFPRKLYIRPIATTGSPMGLSRIYSFIGTFWLNFLFLNAGGAQALAVYGVVSTLNRFVTSITQGVSQTVIPLASVFHEERDATSARQLMRIAFGEGNAAIACISILMLLLREPLGALFGLGGAVLTIPLALNCLYLLLNLNSSVFMAWYNVSGKLLLANLIPFLQDFAVLLPISLALRFSAHTIWAALPLSSFMTLLLLAALLFLLKKKDGRLSFPLLIDAGRLEQGSYVSFSVESHLDDISTASAKLSDFCEENGFSPKDTMLLSMSIEEILGLIAGNNPEGRVFAIAVRLFVLDGTTILRIRNGGVMFNPIKYYEEHITTDLEKNLDIIGIKFIVSKANVVYYRETFGVNNLVIII